MIFKKNNKGQAAIEFLMTYGWMLLVVLIVGALIFSFVDFSALLPNKIDLSNNLKADATASIAYSKDYSKTDFRDETWIVFTYNGAKQSAINATAGIIKTNLGDICRSYQVENLDTDDIAGCPSNDEDCSGGGTIYESTSFLNSQPGVLRFNCSYNLIQGNVIDGELMIEVLNPETGFAVPSVGPMRLTIAQ